MSSLGSSVYKEKQQLAGPISISWISFIASGDYNTPHLCKNTWYNGHGKEWLAIWYHLNENTINLYISTVVMLVLITTWKRHQMETFSALLVLWGGNSRVTGEFPSQSPVTRIFDFFFDLRLNKKLSKQSKRQWFVMRSRSFWRHCSDKIVYKHYLIVLRVTITLEYGYDVGTNRSTYAQKMVLARFILASCHNASIIAMS